MVVRAAYLAFSLIYYVLTLGGRSRRGRVVVLCYHGVPDSQSVGFKWQMTRLRGCAISAEELPRWMRASGKRISPRVCVTFDDGFESVRTLVAPIMREYQIPYTLFVVSGNLGALPQWEIPEGHPDREMRLMTRAEVQEIAREPLCTVGSHTVTHGRASDLAHSDLVRELADSKQALESMVGAPIQDLALPHGAYGAGVYAVARQCGYRYVFAPEPRLLQGSPPDDLVGRFSMSPAAWRAEFLLTCAGAYAWLYAWRRWIRRVRALRSWKVRSLTPLRDGCPGVVARTERCRIVDPGGPGSGSLPHERSLLVCEGRSKSDG